MKCQEDEGEIKATSSTRNSKHEGGLVLANKIFEPLDTLLMDYKSRLKLESTMGKKSQSRSRETPFCYMQMLD